MQKQITGWWWALVWALGLAIPAAIVSGSPELVIGLGFGCLWGALAMRFSIIGRLRAGDGVDPDRLKGGDGLKDK